MDRITRRELLGAGLATGVGGIAGCLGGGEDGGSSGTDGDGGGNGGSTTTGDGGSTGDGSGSLPTWRSAELADVRSGETFAVEDLATPVFLETFAVWCSTCLSQQRELRAFHEEYGDAATSVTLNIDPNEDADRVRGHLENHGFDWRYAISPPPVTDSLVEAFGTSMTVPPRAPVVLVCASGARRLRDGVKSVEDLRAAIDQGC